MDFLSTMNEALKSERDIDKATKEELKVPVLEKTDRIANAKWERESKFKKMTDDNLFFLDSDEGFFFHYNPKENVYFESNASFSFIIDEGPRTSGGRSYYYRRHAPYRFNVINHPKLGSNDELNFRVSKRARKVKLEKIFRGNKIRAQSVDDPLAYIDAFKAAIKFHPELEDYTFSDQKMKVKDFVKSGPETLEAGGQKTIYIAADGDKAKEIMKTGDYKGNVYFDKKTAREEFKNIRAPNIFGAKAILEATVKGSAGFGEHRGDHFEFDGKLDPKRIKISSSYYSAYFDPSFKQPKEISRDRYEAILANGHWGRVENWKKIVEVKQEEKDFLETEARAEEHITKRRQRRKGAATRRSWATYGFDYVVELTLKNGQTILVVKEGTTQEQLDRFIAYRWFESSALKYVTPWEERKTELGYNILFKHQFPEQMRRKMVQEAFGGQNDMEGIKKHIPLPEVK